MEDSRKKNSSVSTMNSLAEMIERAEKTEVRAIVVMTTRIERVEEARNLICLHLLKTYSLSMPTQIMAFLEMLLWSWPEKIIQRLVIMILPEIGIREIKTKVEIFHGMSSKCSTI